MIPWSGFWRVKINTAKHRKQIVVAPILILLTLSLILVPVVLAEAPPGIPQQFSGTVRNNGAPVGAGYTVSARVGSIELASTTTDASGRYGSSELFYFSADQGATIDFYVNGVKTQQTATFSSGAITALDLTVSGVQEPGGSTTALGISTASLSSATVGSSYSTGLQASGGSTPYTWSITSGSLPSGLTLDSGTGTISGTPTTVQTSGFTAQVSDSAGQTSSQALSIVVSTSTPTPPVQSVTISTSILGQASSFTTSSTGVLSIPVTIGSADGRIQLRLAAETTINVQGQSLTVAVEPSPPSPPSNARLISAYDLQPNNTTFSPAFTLTVEYDPASLPPDMAESNLYIAFWTGAVWSELQSSVNTQYSTVSAPVSHFTVFALMGRTGSQPAAALHPGFSVADLKIIPGNVRPGEQATIVAAIVNSSSNQINHTVILSINGATEATQDVELAPGEVKLITFTTTKDTAGSYIVAVGDKSGSFRVGGWALPNISPPFSATIIAIGAGILVATILIIVFSVKARRKKRFFQT